MRLAFITDIHLDHMKGKSARFFLQRLADEKPDAIVSCGDMSEAPDLKIHLGWFAQIIPMVPFYFVLGNHDFYRGSIGGVRAALVGNESYLSYRRDPVALTDNVFLVGHDGWYDGGYGDWNKSRIVMTDYHAIAEFQYQQPEKTLALIQNLAAMAAVKITEASKAAIEHGAKRVIIATHVPPFAICSRGPNRLQSDSDWLPVMSSKRIGDSILGIAADHPSVRFTVLCGHTHTPWIERINANVECIVGNADSTGMSGYGNPTWTMVSHDHNDATSCGGSFDSISAVVSAVGSDDRVP